MRIDSNGATSNPVTWGEWRSLSLQFAAALLASRARETQAVAILAGNGPAWPIADLGTLLCGKTSVGIYPTSAPVQIEKMLADCGAGVLVIDDAKQLDAVVEMRGRLPNLKVIVAAHESPAGAAVTWKAWLDSGSSALAANQDLERSIETRAVAIRRSDPALIIYTSGSTGDPKGAVLSHGCIDASTASIEEALGLSSSDTTLSFLPYSHAAERIAGLYTRIRCGIEATILEDPSRLWEVAASYRPTMFGGLPRYYEKLDQIARYEGRPASEILGGRVRLATSGGAALRVELAKNLERSGVTILGAYGLTEHLCVTFNRPGDATFDTSGSTMPGTEIRTAPDGEILVRRSELTFSGYHNLPDATRAAFSDDGQWLHTGDLGAVDSHGRLQITGRKKELLALSNGKMVAPLPIEARLSSHELIEHAVLHAEGRQFVSALIVLRRQAIEQWVRAQGIHEALDSPASHPRIIEEVQKAVDKVNTELSRAESIRRFVLIDSELSVAGKELTPTHKVRRNAVLEKYSAQLDALYSS